MQASASFIGEMGQAMSDGYQGSGPEDPNAILACAKHFIAYSQTQGGRDASEADLTPRKTITDVF